MQFTLTDCAAMYQTVLDYNVLQRYAANCTSLQYTAPDCTHQFHIFSYIKLKKIEKWPL